MTLPVGRLHPQSQRRHWPVSDASDPARGCLRLAGRTGSGSLYTCCALPLHPQADHCRSIKQHRTTKFTSELQGWQSGMKTVAAIRDNGSGMSLTRAVKTIWSDTDRVSYDVVCYSGCQASMTGFANAWRWHLQAVCSPSTLHERSLPQTMA